MDFVCMKEEFFKNPQKLPLNELNLKYSSLVRTSKDAPNENIEVFEKDSYLKWQECYQIKEEKKPALDKCWLSQHKRYVEYHPYYPQFCDKENEEFFVRNEEFLDGINFLTECTYHQFWCYIICEPRVSTVIKSFLKYSASPYSTIYLSGDNLNLYNMIYSKICDIYERLLDFNKSETEYMSESFIIPFLEKSKLLNIRVIYILCYLYNHSNTKFVKRIVDFYFSNNYMKVHTEELEDLLMDILQNLNELEDLNIKDDPQFIEATSFNMLDQIASLQEFLSIYQPAFDVVLDLEIPQNLPHVYQSKYIELYKKLENTITSRDNWSRYEMLINRWLTIGRAEYINLFHKFITYLSRKMVDLHVNADQEKCWEKLLEIIGAAFDEELFIKDFNKIYPIKSYFHFLTENIPNFDKTHSDYLLRILQNIEEPSEQLQDNYSSNQNGNSTSLNIDEGQYDSLYDTLSEYLHIQKSGMVNTSKTLPDLVQTAFQQYIQLMIKWENNNGLSDYNLDFKHSKTKTSSEINNHIKSVLEMFPELDVDYVKKCFEKLDCRPEQLITKILDNDLPFDLQLPQSATFDSSNPGPSKVTQSKLVPLISKKSNNTDTLQLLNNKTEMQNMKNLILKASYIYDLDDDYDDRNELYNAYESSDESKIYRHLKQSDLPECNVISDPPSSSEDEEIEQNNAQNDKGRFAFCEDPAVVRARREAQRNKKQTHNQAKKSTEKVDNIKQARDKKNTHKSTKANHSRKSGAQWKRNRGMLPC